jgi:hypothetical protein
MRLTKRNRQRIQRIFVWAFLILFMLSITTGLVLLARSQPAQTPVTNASPNY